MSDYVMAGDIAPRSIFISYQKNVQLRACAYARSQLRLIVMRIRASHPSASRYPKVILMTNEQCTTLKVLDNVPFGQIAGEHLFFALRLERPTWKNWLPGQFVMVRPSGWALDMLWARPFSICRVSNRDLVLFFQAVGRGTRRMASLKSGDEVLVWGPLGNSFEMEPDTPTLLLAGGIGIAPFVGYVHTHPRPWNLHMEFGHRMPLNCYPYESINEKIMGDAHHEQNPEDLAAFIDCMDKRIEEFAGQNGLVLACGPTPFLRTVQQLSQKHNARCQLSLETRMACGVGACLGCVTKVSDDMQVNGVAAGRAQVCNHGPVFWAHQVNLSED